jgi:hypothetical protein
MARTESAAQPWSGFGLRSSIRRRYTFLLVCKALLGLLAVDLLGLTHNFGKLHRRVSNWPTRSRRQAHVAQVCHAFNYACVWYPKRVLCLQRSAVLTCLLRGSGIPARMAMGVQSLPFRAHAWVEVDGQPVNERSNVRGIYAILEHC